MLRLEILLYIDVGSFATKTRRHEDAKNHKAIFIEKSIENHMTKKERVIISIGAMIGGSLLCGLAVTNTVEPPVSTICIVFGLVFAVGGFVSLVLTLKGQG